MAGPPFRDPVTVTPSDGVVTTAKLADNAVTSVKIADGVILDVDVAAKGITYPRSGSYLQPPHTNVQTLVLTLNELRACPLPVGKAVTLDRIGLEVTTAVATAVVRLGIYADDGNGYPGALVLDAGTIDASTTGFKEIVINQALAAGLYWLVGVAQTAAPTVRATSGAVPGLSVATSQSTLAGAYTQAGVTGALPANFTAGGSVVTGGSKVLVRVV